MAHVLGAQAQVWTEFIPDQKTLSHGLSAPNGIRRGVWTQRQRKDFVDFSAWLTTHLLRLDALDVAYRPLDGPRWQRLKGRGVTQ